MSAVRSEEMMEARVGAVFASIRQDSHVIALTSGADDKLDCVPHQAASAGALNVRVRNGQSAKF